MLVAAAFFFIRAYPDIAPETRFTPAELEIQRAGGREEETSGDPFSPGESSIDSHLDNLRDGIETVLRHPQGYGLGNAGVTAKRTGAEIKAGESTYTELGSRARARRHARLRRLEPLAAAAAAAAGAVARRPHSPRCSRSASRPT